MRWCWDAVAKERVAMAVKPLVMAAKQDLRVEAEPMVGERMVALRVVRRDVGRRVEIEGPERRREGRIHEGCEEEEEGSCCCGADAVEEAVVLLVVVAAGFGLGGGPICFDRRWLASWTGLQWDEEVGDRGGKRRGGVDWRWSITRRGRRGRRAREVSKSERAADKACNSAIEGFGKGGTCDATV